MDVARASVALPEGTSEVREFPLPDAGPDAAWLRVTASGICGTDVGLYARGVPAPVVLGHHVVGRIASVGERAAERWRVRPGDRVALEEYLPCGRCRECGRGRYRLCPDTDIWSGGRRIGTVPVSEEPSLFGGNAEYAYLPPNAVPHPLPDRLPEDLAVWVLPYANAIDWTAGAGRMRAGENVVVLGPGYHGLAVAAAAVAHGAGRTVVTGLERDAARLEFAAALGATPVTVDEDDNSNKRIAKGLNGEPADLVVDTTGGDPGVLGPAVDLLGHGGRLILTTPKSPALVPFNTAAMTRWNLSVTAVRGRSPEAITRAIASLAGDTPGGASRLERVPTVEVPLDETGDMLSRLASGAGPDTPHVVVKP